MYKALVIGCGNIGAGYDFENDKIITHAKAYYCNPSFSFSVFDANKLLAEKIGKQYNCGLLDEVNENTIASFDCISICSPTDTHAAYLQMALAAKIPLVICEKPVSNDETALARLSELYNNGNSKVLVNYVRRFQPAYSLLQQDITAILVTEKLTHLLIKYQRGFINNCSHAIDLVEFLLNKKLDLQQIYKYGAVNDHFANDPTLSIAAKWNEAVVHIIGLSNVQFGFLELELCFESSRVLIKDAGQTVEIYCLPDKSKTNTLQQLNKTYQDCNKDFMVSVIKRAEEMLGNKQVADNFIPAVQLNQKMLNYLNN